MTFYPGIDSRCTDCPQRLYCSVNEATQHCIWCGRVDSRFDSCCIALAVVLPDIVARYDAQAEALVRETCDGIVSRAHQAPYTDLDEEFARVADGFLYYHGGAPWTWHVLRYTLARSRHVICVCSSCFLAAVKTKLNLV